MLRLTAIQLEAICPYQIIIVFDNGEKSFDVEPYIKGELDLLNQLIWF